MTRARLQRVAGAALLATAIVAVPGSSQVSVGGAVDYLGYSFDEGLGADAAQLFMIPVAVRVPGTAFGVQGLAFDLYSAWAEGRVERQGATLKLSGPVDTGFRAAYQVTPWALVTLGANLPTGNSDHTGEEAIVASILSTDLFGFRETTWGRGFALTPSVAIAQTYGGFGLGLAAAYALRGRFSPSSDPALEEFEYEPGSEARVRLGVDRNFGNSTLTFGATFINYADDRAYDPVAFPDGRNLFAAGRRFRLDATYAWRMGAGVWSAYAADLIRQNGQLSLEVLDSQGASQGFTDVETPSQNLFVAGLIGSVGLGSGFVFRPHVDLKVQSREDAVGSDAGSGWLVALGGDIPIRIFGGYDFFPKARVMLGSIKDAVGEGVGVFGLELKGTVRHTF